MTAELPLSVGRATAERLAGRWVVAGELREASTSYKLYAATFPDLALAVADVTPGDAVAALTGCAAAQEAWQDTLLSEVGS